MVAAAVLAAAVLTAAVLTAVEGERRSGAAVRRGRVWRWRGALKMTVRREIAFVFVFIHDSFTTFELDYSEIGGTSEKVKKEEEGSSKPISAEARTTNRAQREIDPSGPRAYAKPWKMPV